MAKPLTDDQRDLLKEIAYQLREGEGLPTTASFQGYYAHHEMLLQQLRRRGLIKRMELDTWPLTSAGHALSDECQIGARRRSATENAVVLARCLTKDVCAVTVYNLDECGVAYDDTRPIRNVPAMLKRLEARKLVRRRLVAFWMPTEAGWEEAGGAPNPLLLDWIKDAKEAHR